MLDVLAMPLRTRGLVNRRQVESKQACLICRDAKEEKREAVNIRVSAKTKS